jgi:hypothetical protein
VPALVTVALVAAVWVSLHAYELIWWREARAERWAVKTLSDRHADEVNFHPRDTSVRHLRKINNPGVGSDDPRTVPVEFTTYRVKAKLKLAANEDDSDYHLVIAQPGHPHQRMIVEFPDPSCVQRRLKRGTIRDAREAFENACGPIGSSFKQLHGTARISGVGFWDIDHGQTGIAPNAIELHPVLKFRMLHGSC